jgi:phage pi2 protein 07
MTGQETRNKLTDYWKSADIKEKGEFAILTNIIHNDLLKSNYRQQLFADKEEGIIKIA